MSQPEKYDLVVLGSGEGGMFIAWSLGSQGKRSAVVERRYVGGSYPNIACLPSKNVIHSAKVVSYFHRGGEFGITTGAWKVEMPAVRDRKRKMVEGLIASHLEKYRQNNAELVMGEGRFVGPKTIEVVATDPVMSFRLCPFGRKASAQVLSWPTPFCRRDTIIGISTAQEIGADLFGGCQVNRRQYQGEARTIGPFQLQTIGSRSLRSQRFGAERDLRRRQFEESE